MNACLHQGTATVYWLLSIIHLYRVFDAFSSNQYLPIANRKLIMYPVKLQCIHIFIIPEDFNTLHLRLSGLGIHDPLR